MKDDPYKDMLPKLDGLGDNRISQNSFPGSTFLNLHFDYHSKLKELNGNGNTREH